MKYFAPLLTIFALLTSPDGYAVRVVKTQVVEVITSVGQGCAGGPRAEREDAHSVIMLANGMHQCVLENPDKASAEIEKP
jgi:hypothetical protein